MAALTLFATLAGLGAPWWPMLEMANHFRPFLLALAGPSLALGLALRRRGLAATAGVLAMLNLGLALLPWRDAGAREPNAAPALRLVSLNLWVGNRDVEAVARLVEEARPDVVVLQEAGRLQAALVPRLREALPHAFCPDPACTIAILTRQAPLETGKLDAGGRRPLLAWARLPLAGRGVEVIATHLAFPLRPEAQREHVGLLVEHLRGRPGPLVLAGDLNLTPWSWGLNRLTRATGLVRHTTRGGSWPADGWRPGWRPIVLIDHVLSTPDLAAVRVEQGPPVGSDHLPVIADLALRRAAGP